MEKERTWTSFYSRDVGISLEVPVGWEVGKHEDFELLILAPPKDGFRVNVGINKHSFSGDQNAFISAIKAAVKNLEEDYHNYQKEGDEEGWIDGYPAYHHRYSWSTEDNAMQLKQTLTLLYDTKSELFEINGTVLSEMDEAFLETVERIVFSVRLVS